MNYKMKEKKMSDESIRARAHRLIILAATDGIPLPDVIADLNVLAIIHKVIELAIAEERKPRAKTCEDCEWAQDIDGVWQTECGNMFCIDEGTPQENQLNYCPYCGKHLMQINRNDEVSK